MMTEQMSTFEQSTFVLSTSTPEEIEHRNAMMEQIIELRNTDPDEFLWRLLTDGLPDFKRAQNGDSDYVCIHRDTNHEGLSYALFHVSRLRQMSTRAYVENNFWAFDNEAERNTKMYALIMRLIDEMPESRCIGNLRIQPTKWAFAPMTPPFVM